MIQLDIHYFQLFRIYWLLVYRKLSKLRPYLIDLVFEAHNRLAKIQERAPSSGILSGELGWGFGECVVSKNDALRGVAAYANMLQRYAIRVSYLFRQ